MSSPLLHPLLAAWFARRFEAPTEAQAQGWPQIAAGADVLIAAPTGSGKTLAAFLVALDRLYREQLAGTLAEETQVVYVSPLKALSSDIQRNLQLPLEELSALAVELGFPRPALRTAVRTGDTPARERQAMLRRPPHVLVTTPESFFLLLTSARSRERLRGVRTVIVDEIHALARDKRGSHLALSLERLSHLVSGGDRPQRIGLSATQRPIDEIARFLVGCDPGSTQPRSCAIVDAGHVRDRDLAIDVPPSDLEAVCSHEQWREIYARLGELIQAHRSTLIFVNTRRMSERVAHQLAEMLGREAVTSHHGSLSRPLRLDAEQRLKQGELKAIVATASLEMGIDIGYIDLVCQIGSPRSIATFLQRVGRSGHALHARPKGRLFPLTRDELLECLALIHAVRRGELDRIDIPQTPLDIAAQQIVAEIACEPWDEKQLLALLRQAWPFRQLSEEDYESLLRMLTDGVAAGTRRGAHLLRDRIHGQLRARKGARQSAISSGGAIPEQASYRVVVEPDDTVVGTVDEDFAIESLAGDVFLLGNHSWRIRYVRGGDVVVQDAQGLPPSIPFWLGEAPGRTRELSDEVSYLRAELDQRLDSVAASAQSPDSDLAPSVEWLAEACSAPESAAWQAVRYVHAQRAALGTVPTHRRIIFERFFDDSGGMQLVIHAPLGSRINRAWGLALRKRFCRSYDFELQAAATDNGVLLSLGPQHSFPIDSLFRMLRSDNGRSLLEQAVLAVPLFRVRWRWNITRALAVLRQHHGRKVPPHLQRFRSDDLLSAVFPDCTGCLENHSGDVPIPDHPLVRQTMHDCFHEAMDVEHWLELLADIESQRVELLARDTREPSPFAHEILNANPYAFLDGAPLEERRTRALALPRSLAAQHFAELTRLDPAAIEQVRNEAWPLVRDADELHSVLLDLVLLRADEQPSWQTWFEELARDGRAISIELAPAVPPDASPPLAAADKPLQFWSAAEHSRLVQAVFPQARVSEVMLPASLDVVPEVEAARVEVVRGRLACTGPWSPVQLARHLALEPAAVQAACESLEGQGLVLRGHFSNGAADSSQAPVEFCDRRLLARIHRLTIDGLRKQIEPVDVQDFLHFLQIHHRVGVHDAWGGPAAVREILSQLEGFEAPAWVWEHVLLPARILDYRSEWLDHVFLAGEAVWGRLSRPASDDRCRPLATQLTRGIPLSIMLREDLAWLLPAGAAAVDVPLRGAAGQVRDVLATRGPLFHPQLLAAAGLLPTQLEEALRELAGLGLVTADTFLPVRAFVAAPRRGGRPSATSGPVGRWSPFPPHADPSEDAVRREHWCRQLLKRYGVVFRELLDRESVAPRWRELVPVFRRLELRGEIRGGRFVRGVSGEQYGTAAAVQQLRAARQQTDSAGWSVISAADPLNLFGILAPGPRVPALHTNFLIIRQGRCVAVRQTGRIEFLETVESIDMAAMRRSLQLGRRVHMPTPQEAFHA